MEQGQKAIRPFEDNYQPKPVWIAAELRSDGTVVMGDIVIGKVGKDKKLMSKLWEEVR